VSYRQPATSTGLSQLRAPRARRVNRTHIASARLVPTPGSLTTPASGAADSQAIGGFGRGPIVTGVRNTCRGLRQFIGHDADQALGQARIAEARRGQLLRDPRLAGGKGMIHASSLPQRWVRRLVGNG